MAFVDDISGLCTQIVVATPVTIAGDGDVTLGTPVNLTTCYISQKNRIVRDGRGREVVSSAKIISLGVNSLNTNYRFTLPAAYPDPRTNIEPVSVKLVSDETGPIFETIFLP